MHSDHRIGKLADTDFTPEDMEAVRACFGGVDRSVPVASAKLLAPNTVRTVADILNLPT